MAIFNSSIFNILQWNTRSLSARLQDISSILHSYNISVAIISESWLRPGSRVNIPGFHLIRANRPDGYGGACIAVHESIIFRVLTLDPNIVFSLQQNNIDLVDIEIFINTVNKMDVWSCYIPSNSNVLLRMLSNIFDNLTSNCIFGGDLNGHHYCWGSDNIDHRGNLIFSALADHNLCILNDGSPTRVNRPPYPDTAVDITLSSPNIPLICN